MIWVERHFNSGSPEIQRLCYASKVLYNKCNFIMRHAWLNNERLPDLVMLVQEVKDLECFQNLHNTKTAKQTIRRVVEDWSNFRKALTVYRKDPSRFIKRPEPPHYKEKMAQVIFYNETIKGGQSGKQLTRLTPTNNCLSVPCDKPYKQLVITPKAFGFVIEVQYEVKKEKPKHKLDKQKVATIDVGVNTLAAITLSQKRPILANGRVLKSINQWYNKRPCKSRLRKRYWRLENYFHHASKMIVDLCIENQIGRIIVGKNDGWKQKTKGRMRRKERQSFQFIPFCSFLQKLQYKAEAASIEVIYTEEAYTSQSSFFDNDPLPKHGDAVPEFSGERKHRGLYVSNGYAVNADVNGSLNIGRKVIPEFFGIGDRSLAARPIVINPLKVFMPVVWDKMEMVDA